MSGQVNYPDNFDFKNPKGIEIILKSKWCI